MTAETAVEEIALGMANATRMRAVGRLCLQAALMRLASEIDSIADVHAAAIANEPGVAAELKRLKSAAAESIHALKGSRP